MRAHPKLGQITPQEDARGVADDKARILGVDATVSPPYGTVRHCTKTRNSPTSRRTRSNTSSIALATASPGGGTCGAGPRKRR